MRIRSVTIEGFRGFNEQRTILFHDRLTTIYAPNSYGKTSITEGLEWLLYGITSKVEKADSKEEYKNSYRNRHLPDGRTPFVSLTFAGSDTEIEYKAELGNSDVPVRFLNGKSTPQWPLASDLRCAPKPFILQHALKHLLLASPDERFRGFALLLGLEDLDLLQKNIISLCTKPELPKSVNDLQTKIVNLENTLVKRTSLDKISKGLKKGLTGLENAHSILLEECLKRVPIGTASDNLLTQLTRKREDAVKNIFKGKLNLSDYTDSEKSLNSSDEASLVSTIAETFLEKYLGLVKLNTLAGLVAKIELFDLGVKLLINDPNTCPLCDQPITNEICAAIHEEHHKLTDEKSLTRILNAQKGEVIEALSAIRKRIGNYHSRHLGKASTFTPLSSSLPDLEKIMTPKHQLHFEATKSALSELVAAKIILDSSLDLVLTKLTEIDTSIEDGSESSDYATALAQSILDYVAQAKAYGTIVSSHSPRMALANSVLQQELDVLAGVEDVSLLMELLIEWPAIKKRMKIEEVLSGLKGLRKSVDQFVATTMQEAVSGELTTEVMDWYSQIRTSGDPDIHFDGFDIEQTAKGDLKGRRVQVKATTYGKSLASAVSSLSESKLNALGLCVHIATNLKRPSPFDFLIIDDPIQSWDAEHETQFIEVIRKLVSSGKQVVLLSHNKKWMREVIAGCRSINGWHYEITGYTAAGPHISETPWEDWRKRLSEVDSIVNAPTATHTCLQRAEGEIRIAIEDLTAELWRKVKGTKLSGKNMNSGEVRKRMIECGAEIDLVDRICQTFENTDPAHHADPKYVPERQRIKKYHSWVHELGKFIFPS